MSEHESSVAKSSTPKNAGHPSFGHGKEGGSHDKGGHSIVEQVAHATHATHHGGEALSTTAKIVGTGAEVIKDTAIVGEAVGHASHKLGKAAEVVEHYAEKATTKVVLPAVALAGLAETGVALAKGDKHEAFKKGVATEATLGMVGVIGEATASATAVGGPVFGAVTGVALTGAAIVGGGKAVNAIADAADHVVTGARAADREFQAMAQKNAAEHPMPLNGLSARNGQLVNGLGSQKDGMVDFAAMLKGHEDVVSKGAKMCSGGVDHCATKQPDAGVTAGKAQSQNQGHGH